MDDIRSFNFLQKRDMPVYGRKEVLDQLKREFAYIFEENKYPGVPKVQLNTIENSPFEINGIEFLPVEVMHYKLPVFGFRIKDFTYITDAKTISSEEKEKINGSKVLILDALQKEDHLSHLTLSEALALIEELDVEMVYLTHISHRMGLHKDVNAELPDNVMLAYDGLQIEL